MDGDRFSAGRSQPSSSVVPGQPPCSQEAACLSLCLPVCQKQTKNPTKIHKNPPQNTSRQINKQQKMQLLASLYFSLIAIYELFDHWTVVYKTGRDKRQTKWEEKKNQVVRHSNSEELSPARWCQSCFRLSLWGCVACCTGQWRSRFISCWESRGTSFTRDKLAIGWKSFERVFLSQKKKLLIKAILVRALGKHNCWP